MRPIKNIVNVLLVRNTSINIPEYIPEGFTCYLKAKLIFILQDPAPHFFITMSNFKSACLDVEAQEYVIEKAETRVNNIVVVSMIVKSKSQTAFPFGDGCFPSIGQVIWTVPTPG